MADIEEIKIDLLAAGSGPCQLDQISDGDRAAIKALGECANIVADVGTFLGASAEALCSGMVGRKGEKYLVTVDAYVENDSVTGQLYGSANTSSGTPYQEFFIEYVRRRLEKYTAPGDIKVTHIREFSVNAAKAVPDGSLDLVFIDAGHDYDSVISDIRAWAPKVRKGGMIAGHDYERESIRPVTKEYIMDNRHLEYDPSTRLHPGVIAAVWDSFNNVLLPEGDTTIWVAGVENLKNGAA